MPAFEHAIALGYRYIETDVHVTADGVLLAFHDDVLDRVTDGNGRDRGSAVVRRTRRARSTVVSRSRCSRTCSGAWPDRARQHRSEARRCSRAAGRGAEEVRCRRPRVHRRVQRRTARTRPRLAAGCVHVARPDGHAATRLGRAGRRRAGAPGAVRAGADALSWTQRS